MIDLEFYKIVKDIIKSKEFKQMKKYKHHVRSTLFNHSLKVAYMCYKHYKKKNVKKVKLEEFVQAALLHDYYLYDWHEKLNKLHLFTHPKKAAINATNKYPNLNKRQINMIERHMFPLTLIPPKYKASWLICYYDKLAAMGDYFGKNKWKRSKIKV